MSLPTLGLLTTPEPTAPRIGPLLQRLTQWCVVRAVTARPDEQVAAWFATGPRARRLARVVGGEVPVAVWVSDDEDTARLPEAANVVAVGEDPALLDHVGARRVLWPDGIDAELRWPVAPFVRARLRRRWGLPDQLVWLPDELNPPASEDVTRTAFALASAVAVTGGAVVEALAWGAPVVTDAATAASVGADDGGEVVVAEPASFRRTAVRVSADQRLSAALSRAGRSLVERRHDTARPAGVLASLLGLRREPADPAGRVAACLDDLWTPATNHIRVRAEGHALARAAR